MIMTRAVVVVAGLVLCVAHAAYAEKPASDNSTSSPIRKTDAPDSPVFNDRKEAEQSCTCTHGGSQYSKGATICWNHVKLECGCGGWFKVGSC
jgi:hypothetical protein